MNIKKYKCKVAKHYSVDECQGLDCIYFEATNPYGSWHYCRAYQKEVEDIGECERCMDKNHPYPNPYYKNLKGVNDGS